MSVTAYEVACENGLHAYTVQVPASYHVHHFRECVRFCAWCPPKMPRSKPREGVSVTIRRAQGEIDG